MPRTSQDFETAQAARTEAASGRGRARFEGRTILVTGAANGIGAAIARQFVLEGGEVYGVDIAEAALTRVEESLRDHPGTFSGVVGDVSDTPAFEKILAQATAKTGRLDVLVNNAAVFLLGGVDATDHQWTRTMEVNLVGPAKLTAAAARYLEKSSHAAVVNVASISAFAAAHNRWTYNAAKGGVVAVTKCEALDLAPRGIRVNSVSPGYIWTDVLDRSVDGDRATWDPRYGAASMLDRCAEPAEVATAVAFLASDDASYITATDLVVDGGLLGMTPDGKQTYEFAS